MFVGNEHAICVVADLLFITSVIRPSIVVDKKLRCHTGSVLAPSGLTGLHSYH